MFQFFGVIAVLMTMSFAHLSLAQAESWDLGYSNAKTEVEVIPDSINDERGGLVDQKAAIVEVGAEVDQEKPPIRPSSSSITKISTAQNTFGVETVEKPGLKFFLSPVAGLTSILGNATVEILPQYAFGGRVGLLISDNMMIEGGYIYAAMTTSGALQNTNVGVVLGNSSTDVFNLKQGVADAGVKLFFLGRESRFRPFIGGGLAYANSTMNYTQNHLNNTGGASGGTDFNIKQLQGAGQLGAEFAFTRAIVVTAAFKLNGVLTSSTSLDSNGGAGIDQDKAAAGSSLSRSASYTGTVGVGVYF